MIRNLKTLALSLLAVFAVGAVAASGASATGTSHDFHADGPSSILIGQNTDVHEFTIGAAGVVKCNKVTLNGTQVGSEVSAGTWVADTKTSTPKYEECTFGGNAATVKFNSCDYQYDSDTTTGNPTGGEHATVAITCTTAGDKIEIETSVCTLTIPPQSLNDAVSYVNEPGVNSAIETITTAHSVEIGNLGGKAGCALIPKGKVGKCKGTVTSRCFKNEGGVPGATTECTVSNAPGH